MRSVRTALIGTLAILSLYRPVAGQDRPNMQNCIKAENFQRHLPLKLEYSWVVPGTIGSSVITYAAGAPIRYENTSSIGAEMITRQTLEFDTLMRPIGGGVFGAGDVRVLSLKMADGVVSGSAMKKGGEMTEVQETVSPGTVLPGAVRALLPVIDFESCPEGDFDVFLPGRPSTKTTYQVLKKGRTTVPAGDFDSYTVRLKTRDGTVEAELRSEYPHIILKEPIPATVMVHMLTAIKRE